MRKNRFHCPVTHQSAKPFTANNLAVTLTHAHRTNRHIANSLVRSFCLIMREEFRDDVIEMLPAENHEMIQALLLKRLNKSFDVSSRELVCFDSFPGVFEDRFGDRAATRN